MDAMIQRLAEVVQQEVAVYQAILEAVTVEQQALVGQEMETLQAALRTQAELARRAAALEKVRQNVVAPLAEHLGEDPAGLTLKRLIVRVGGPRGEQLRGMREALIDAHDRIQQTNRHNGTLIRQSMKYVDRTLHILSGEEAPTGVYAGSGKLATRKSGGQAVVDRVA